MRQSTFIALVSVIICWSALVCCVAGVSLPAALRTLDAASTVSSGAQLERSFDADATGFHRTLVTQLAFQSAGGPRCSILLRETLPPTFYFDLYQLDELTRFNDATFRQLGEGADSTISEQVVHVYSERDVELERSAEASQEYTLWLHVPRPQWHRTRAADGATTFNATIRVPIHARYQAARISATHADARIGPPTVYVKCAEGSPDELTSTGWSRYELTPSLRHTVEMQVPVGNLAHLALVRLGTFLVTMSAAVALCVIVWWQVTRAGREANSNHTD
jgi:hypothetical protein